MINIEVLRGRLKELIKKADADDSKKLKAEIARSKAEAGAVIDTARVKELKERNRVLRR